MVLMMVLMKLIMIIWRICTICQAQPYVLHMSSHIISIVSSDQYYYHTNFTKNTVEIALGYIESKSHNRNLIPDVPQQLHRNSKFRIKNTDHLKQEVIQQNAQEKLHFNFIMSFKTMHYYYHLADDDIEFQKC